MNRQDWSKAPSVFPLTAWLWDGRSSRLLLQISATSQYVTLHVIVIEGPNPTSAPLQAWAQSCWSSQLLASVPTSTEIRWAKLSFEEKKKSQTFKKHSLTLLKPTWSLFIQKIAQKASIWEEELSFVDFGWGLPKSTGERLLRGKNFKSH